MISDENKEDCIRENEVEEEMELTNRVPKINPLVLIMTEWESKKSLSKSTGSSSQTSESGSLLTNSSSACKCSCKFWLKLVY